MSTSNPRTITVSRTFTLLQPLGEGSMGEVYEAVETELCQRLAVKVLRSELAADREVSERFAAEAGIMAAIDHPGNLPVYGLGTDADGRPFYAMKKVAGRTLGELLAQRGERIADLTWLARLLDLFEAVCDTVACAHEAGIVHRDLKPENILVDERHGSVYVVDWGIAKRTSLPAAARTLDGAVMGSPGYLSPEQAGGKSAAAGPPADVFALGAILYEILTGHQPFAGDTLRESVLKAIHRRPRDPRRHNAWVSRSLAAVCRKALEKDPSRRYPTAGALAEDVRAYRAGRRVSATRPSIPERARGWALRRPGRAALALAAASSLLLLAVFVGAQVWVDQRLAEKAYRAIAATDAEIAEIDRQLRAVATSPGTGANETAAGADSRRRELQARRLVRQFEAMTLLANVAQLRFIRTGDQVLARARARVFGTVDNALANDEPALAKAIAAAVLENAEAGTTLLRFSPAEIERLRSLAAEADAAPASRPESTP